MDAGPKQDLWNILPVIIVIHRAKDTISVENILHVCLLDSFAGVVNFKDEEVLLLM